MADQRTRPVRRRAGASVGAHAAVGLVVLAIGAGALVMGTTGEEAIDTAAEDPGDLADQPADRELATSEPEPVAPDPDQPDPSGEPDPHDPDDPDDPDDPSDRNAGEATGAVTVEGDALAPVERDDHGAVVADPARGEPAPSIEGTSLDGEPLTIGEPEEGKPQLIVGIAHWCSASRAEVDVLSAAKRADALPAGVDLMAVSTAVDAERDPHTFPPADWLAEAGWEVPTLRDDAESTAVSVLSGDDVVTPYWVAVDAQGRIVERRTTRQAVDELAAWMEELAHGP